jgi:hypothetical protein
MNTATRVLLSRGSLLRAIDRRRFLGALGVSYCSLLTCLRAVDDGHVHLPPKKRANARGRHESFAAHSKKNDPRIEALVSQIDTSRLTASLKALTALPTRSSLSPHLTKARAWIAEQFANYGYSQQRIREVATTMPDGTVVRNVLCLPEQLDRGFTLIGAHYDSTSQQPDVSAPGADDNATGVAALLETARLFSTAQLKRGVGFVAFAGEEQGLFGSKTVASLAAKEKWPIDVYVNLDMVGHVDPVRPTNIMVEYDQGNSSPLNDPAAKAFGLQMAQHAADYTKLTVEHTDIWSSDYMPFEATGVPCIGLYDGAADAPFYHSIDDTVENVDVARMAAVCAMLCAFVATAAGIENQH